MEEVSFMVVAYGVRVAGVRVADKYGSSGLHNSEPVRYNRLMALSYQKFLKSLPEVVVPLLPPVLQGIKSRQPFRWIIQFHFGEPRLHYEVSSASGRTGLELGLHFEARDRDLNRYLLAGFRRHLFEVKQELGEGFEAEMWDRGWSKIYEVYPLQTYSEAYQLEVGRRLAEIIVCLQPILSELRNDVRRIYR